MSRLAEELIRVKEEGAAAVLVTVYGLRIGTAIPVKVKEGSLMG